MPRVAVSDIRYSQRFTVDTQRVDIGNSFDFLGDVTVLLWAKMNGDGGGTGGRLLDNGKFVLRYNPSTGTLFFTSNGSLAAYSDGFHRNSWIPIAVTRTDTGVVNFRLNFAQSGALNQVSGTPASPSANMYIGNFSGGKNWSGYISNVSVYNRILSTAEQNIALASFKPVTGVYRLYNLQEGAGTTATDLSGNGINGTIYDGTWSTDTPSKLRTSAVNRLQTFDKKCSLSNVASGGYVFITNSNNEVIDITQSHTVFLRFKPFLIPSANERYLFTVPASTGNNRRYISYTGNTGALNFSVGPLLPISINRNIRIGEWQTIAMVVDAATNRWRAYCNGELARDWTDFVMGTGNSTLNVGDNASASNASKALFSSTFVWQRALNDAEILTTHKTNVPSPTDLRLNWGFEEGTGTTIYDLSGEGKHGTITGALAFVADVPSKKRQTIGNNMVYNGGFEFAPLFVAATNTSGRYIDGTAAGSATNKLFGWYGYSLSTTNTAKFDASVCHSGTKCLKIVGDSYDAEVFSSDIATTANMIKVDPNTSYTMRGWIKTNKISGSGSGACLAVSQRKGDGTWNGVIDSISSFVSDSTDWVEKTITLTTGATCQYLVVKARNFCTSGGSLVMDAWFDDITLAKTTPDTRGIVS